MPRLSIDGREVEAPAGGTILDAARRLGIHIPTLCFRDGLEPSTACMVCVVKLRDGGTGGQGDRRTRREGEGQPGRFVPACGMKAEDGMQVESDTEEVQSVRRAAIELLLSDHIGDCIAPCQRTCPAHVNIPRVLREIAGGDFQGALVTVREHLAIPAVLGRICPAPCEKGCRRSQHDMPVAIRLLKRLVADVGLADTAARLPAAKPATGKKVAVVGAGPAGLSAAYYLLLEGIVATVFDEHEQAGGALRYSVPEDRLPRAVLDAEIRIIERLGGEFRLGVCVGRDIGFDELRSEYDALVLATGAPQATGPNLKPQPADRHTGQTAVPGVFAAGGVILPGRLAVRSAAAGRNAAAATSQYLAGAPVSGVERPWTCRIDKLLAGELAAFVAGANGRQRLAPSGGDAAGLAADEAHQEALRCLHCDCRKADACQLRRYAHEYGASARLHYYVTPEGGEERRRFEVHAAGRGQRRLIYEPGKCIACGLCVKIAEKAGEPLGLAFIGRSFGVRVSAPFGRPLAEGLGKVMEECVAACPTGALALE